MDTNGNLQNFKLPCCYVQKLQQRLLSTTAFSKTHPDSSISVTAEAWTITQNRQTIDIHINPRNNLPTSTCFQKSGINSIAAHLGESVVSMANQNLSEPQKELLCWHCRLGHVGLQTIQFMMRSGALVSSKSMRRLHTQASKVPHGDLP